MSPTRPLGLRFLIELNVSPVWPKHRWLALPLFATQARDGLKAWATKLWTRFYKWHHLKVVHAAGDEEVEGPGGHRWIGQLGSVGDRVDDYGEGVHADGHLEVQRRGWAHHAQDQLHICWNCIVIKKQSLQASFSLVCVSLNFDYV